MSTKAIRELIRLYENLAEAHHLGASTEQQIARNAALAEVEAIERAAMAIADTDADSAREEFNQAVALLERITEQRKAH